MDQKQIDYLKKEVETQIADLLSSFSVATGVRVKYVESPSMAKLKGRHEYLVSIRLEMKDVRRKKRNQPRDSE
jgi:hypothetical protein